MPEEHGQTGFDFESPWFHTVDELHVRSIEQLEELQASGLAGRLTTL